MPDGHGRSVPAPSKRSARWTFFVGRPARGRVTRGLHGEGNPEHRLRAEHNKHTLLIHVSNEDGDGWTTIALDRPTREWAVAQRARRVDAAQAACGQLYGLSRS